MPWVRNGTVSVTNGSASVTGASTTFQGSGVLPGHTFIGPDARLYEVLTVTSNTAMTIAPNYLGSTAAGQAYQIDTGPDALGQTVYQRVLELLNWIGGSIPAASAFLGTPSTPATTGSVFAARGVRAVFESASEFLLRVSRASSSHAAMLVFDDANSGRWRVGMKAASADLYIQRSADGTTFTDAVEVNATTGAATFLGGIVGGGGGGGGGDVTGPASSVNNRIAVFSGTTGKIIADSGSTTASFAAASHTHTAAQVTDFASAVSSATAGKLDTSGGTMTGFLTLSGAPTNANHAATKSYVDSNASAAFVLLGTLNTTSGAIQTLSGLNLTSYKFLRIDIINISHNSATNQALLVGPSLGAVTSVQGSTVFWTGIIDVNLSSGIGIGIVGNAGRDGATGLSTASTSVSLSVASGAFDSGSATIYGVR